MTLEDGRRLFGKIYATSHERADRWYRFGRTILYGQLEDETPMGSVRRLATYEDYALRLLADHQVRVAQTFGVVELTPNQEYMLVTEFFENTLNLGDAQVDDVVIDEGLAMVRTFWDIGVAHRDIKPANLLVKDGHLQLVDVSGRRGRPRGGRPSTSPTCSWSCPCGPTPSRSTPAPPWSSPPTRSPRRARHDPGLTIPTELQAKLKVTAAPCWPPPAAGPATRPHLHPALEPPAPHPHRRPPRSGPSCWPACSWTRSGRG